MTRLAIVEPMTLMGRALRDGLASRRDLFDEVELFTSDPEEVGAVTEAGGRAALVQKLQRESLETFDLAIFCGREVDEQALAALPEAALAVLIDPSTEIAEAEPIVAGVNLEQVAGYRRLVSPHPAVVLLASLLHALRDCDPSEVVAHLLQPASAHDQRGLDELFEQTRSILSMRSEQPHDEFGCQLAFNLLPVAAATSGIESQLERVLGRRLRVALQRSQAGVFHCYATSVLVRLDNDPGLESVRARLIEQRSIELSPRPDLLGPIDAAASEKILVGGVSPASEASYWIWAVMDNLTCGGVNNALALVAARRGATA